MPPPFNMQVKSIVVFALLFALQYIHVIRGDDAMASPVMGSDASYQNGTAGDVEFIDSMIPHHLGAMEMAQMEIAHGCNASVITMASRINESQAEEVEFMKNVRLEITGNDTVMPMANDTHMMEDMGLLMNASCIQLDRLFLEHMIPHHARAITMAHESLHKLTRDDLNTLAINIIDAQVNEISKLYHLLKCLDHSHGNDDAAGPSTHESGGGH
jgi:uncharacterized protein (DUF305 family)